MQVRFLYRALVFINLPQVFGLLFSDDRDVVLLVSKVMPLVASFQVADGLAGSCGGVLRGQGNIISASLMDHKLIICSTGRQHLGALFNVIAYYVLALPMGITLAFHPSLNYGLQGLWVGESTVSFLFVYIPLNRTISGQVVALFIVGISEYCVVWRGTDWDLEIKKSIERNREEGERHFGG